MRVNSSYEFALIKKIMLFHIYIYHKLNRYLITDFCNSYTKDNCVIITDSYYCDRLYD